MRIVFFGAGKFGVPALQKLAAAHKIVRVFCPPPRPSGRKMRAAPCPLADAARGLALPLSETAADGGLAAENPDAIVACDYGALLPDSVLRLAPRALNIHPSLLPRWRGAAPIARAILAGDKETGVTIMQMNAQLDGGGMHIQKKVPILPETTGGALGEILSETGADMLLQTLRGDFPARPQDSRRATYAAKITAADRMLDFGGDAVFLARQVRAFAPAPGAFTFLAGGRVNIRAAHAVDATGAPGTVLAADGGGIVVACGRGALSLLQLQRAGRGVLAAAEFVRGFSRFPDAFQLPADLEKILPR